MKLCRSRWRGVALAAASGLALAGCAAQEIPDSPRPTIIPLDTRVDDGGRINKWVRPIRVSLVGAGAAKHRAFVTQVLENLQTVSGHRIAMADGNDADTWIIFGAETQMAALARHAEIFAPLYSNEAAMAADLNNEPILDPELCLSKRGMSTEKPHEIVYAVGQVAPWLSEDGTQKCILRLLLTALGGSATTEAIVLLTVWYDSRVEPGMTVDEVKPIMREKTLQLLDHQLRAQ